MNAIIDEKSLHAISLDHGTGAKLSRELVEIIVNTLKDVYIGEMEDSAIFSSNYEKIACTTDSFVVEPAFFLNGDIGKISVCGTVNDIAVMGAIPKYLTLALILEEGFLIRDLIRVLKSIRETALEAGVKIVAGDTKVVRKGEADGIYINTTGIGFFNRNPLRMSDVEVGNSIILSGYIGNHTVHLLSIREGLGFEQRVFSDCAPLNGLINSLLLEFAGKKIRSIRDVTRGGFSAVMHEYASATSSAMEIHSSKLPIQAETAMAANMLGIDPINCANEGCMCLFVEHDIAEDIVRFLNSHQYGKHAAIVGKVVERNDNKVTVIDSNGIGHSLKELEGAELPRLC